MEKSIAQILSLLSAAVITAGCSNQQIQPTSQMDLDRLQQKERVLAEQEKALEIKESQLKEKEHALETPKATQPPPLPATLSRAKPGQCFARVWVETTYQHYSKSILTKESSEYIETIPAKFQLNTEQVMIKSASDKIIPIPAQYKTVQERVLITPASLEWRVSPDPKSPPAEKYLLDKAQAHGIQFDNAKPGMCFHEHYHPAWYNEQKETILVKEPSTLFTITEPKFRWVEKKMLVKAASTRLEEIPARYETIKVQLLDIPAHVTWEPCADTLSAHSAEGLCKKNVPAQYKTVSKQVLKTPATVKTIAILAEYKTVRVKTLVTPASQHQQPVTAQYQEVTTRTKVEDTSFTWHEINNQQLPKKTRTGNQICLVETPAVYQTLDKQVLVAPARTKTVAQPAEYQAIKVQKLLEPAKEVRHVIPAEYNEIILSKIDQPGHMEWRAILCESNMDTSTIRSIQTRLLNQGYSPGPIDGIVGKKTMRAVHQFQADHKLPSDPYINIETVKALGLSQ